MNSPVGFRNLMVLTILATIGATQILTFLETASAQSNNGLTVETDSEQYMYNPDTITVMIFGHVASELIEPDAQVKLHVYSPGGKEYPAQSASIRDDGSYIGTFDVAGEMGTEGKYNVTATYQTASVETSFRVIDAILESVCSRPCEFILDVGNGTQSVKYLSGNRIRNITVDYGAKSLDIIPNPGTQGLTIVLPRSIIDSKEDNSDKNYTVLIDGREFVFTPTLTDRQYEFTEIHPADYGQLLTQGEDPQSVRVLQLLYPPGLHRIDIIGTQIVPEFSLSGIMTVSAISVWVAVTAVTILTKRAKRI